MYIYAIQCQQNKYYIGKSNYPEFRIKKHYSGNGSVFTKKFKPLKLIECKLMTSPFDENNLTKQYMNLYGINNVRGGSFCQLELSSELEQLLEDELVHTYDKCYKCQQHGHVVNDCSYIPINNQTPMEKIKEFCRSKQFTQLLAYCDDYLIRDADYYWIKFGAYLGLDNLTATQPIDISSDKWQHLSKACQLGHSNAKLLFIELVKQHQMQVCSFHCKNNNHHIVDYPFSSLKYVAICSKIDSISTRIIRYPNETLLYKKIGYSLK